MVRFSLLLSPNGTHETSSELKEDCKSETMDILRDEKEAAKHVELL